MSTDYFEHKAEGYEKDSRRVDNVGNIARRISESIEILPSMTILDFGSGTGLLLENMAPLVKKIVAVDVSTSMNGQLEKKRERLECELEIIEADLSVKSLDRKFDGIISSMTLHHVEDTARLLKTLYSMLHDGGFIALADLDTEDGSFHTEDTGVFHFGFDRALLGKAAAKAGFRDVDIQTASTISKPQGDYPVFLLTASR